MKYSSASLLLFPRLTHITVSSSLERKDGLLLSHPKSTKKDNVSNDLKLSIVEPIAPIVVNRSEPLDLRFDRLQPSDRDLDPALKRDFGKFTARAALIDEEYWAASWLRAETNWENQPDLRNVQRLKMQYAEQEFNALKKRCTKTHNVQKCFCMVAVKKEEKNAKRIALSSIIGTLDLYIRHLFQGEIYPAESRSTHLCNIYQINKPQFGYICNLCVSKFSRRQGVAKNMMAFAIDTAFSHGVENIFVHVHKENFRAQSLYEKLGFKIVDRNGLKESDNLLLSL
ncbi:hypothetical protein LUZ60_005626 [Juncus effusus]|nr:hypothetical protein LUZ60_005626 [Juncus effusus]